VSPSAASSSPRPEILVPPPVLFFFSSRLGAPHLFHQSLPWYGLFVGPCELPQGPVVPLRESLVRRALALRPVCSNLEPSRTGRPLPDSRQARPWSSPLFSGEDAPYGDLLGPPLSWSTSYRALVKSLPFRKPSLSLVASAPSLTSGRLQSRSISAKPLGPRNLPSCSLPS